MPLTGTSGVQPPPQPPRAWHTFPIEQLLDHVPQLVESSGLITLDNEVHPIFGKDRLSPDFSYEALLPALRLASLLITTPETLDYWYAALLSTPQDVAYVDRAETFKAIFRKNSPLTAEDLARIQACFRALVPNVAFVRKDLGMSSAGATACLQHENLRGPTALKEASGVDWNGHPSIVVVGDRMYCPLIAAIADVERDPSPQNRQRLVECYFDFASTIVHELAHVVSNARWGRIEDALMPFENQLVCEDGFDWEASLFGGLMQMFRVREAITIVDWPSAYEAEFYAKQGVVGAAFQAPWEVWRKEAAVAWRVSPSFISRMFLKAFWDQVVPAVEAEAFKPPRLMGVRMAPMSAQVSRPCGCERCLAFEEFMMRANRRGNGPMIKAGTYTAEVSARAVNVAKTDSHRLAEEHGGKTLKSTYKGKALDPTRKGKTLKSTKKVKPHQSLRNGKPLKPTTMTPEPPAPADSLPTCFMDNRWAKWYCSEDASDTRDARTFGLPPGFHSLVDGSVIARSAYLTVMEWKFKQATKSIARQGRSQRNRRKSEVAG